jgi:rubrerythrin
MMSSMVHARIGAMVADQDGGWLFADRFGDVYRIRVQGLRGFPLEIVIEAKDAVCRQCGGYGAHPDTNGCPSCGRIQPGPV